MWFHDVDMENTAVITLCKAIVGNTQYVENFATESSYSCRATLQWRHNERDGVPNHRRLDGLFNHFFRRRSKKRSKLCVTGLCEGNSPVTSPHKGPVARKMLMTSSWTQQIVTLWHGHPYRITSPLWGESTSDPWITVTKGYKAIVFSSMLNQQSSCWWFETPWGSCNVIILNLMTSPYHQYEWSKPSGLVRGKGVRWPLLGLLVECTPFNKDIATSLRTGRWNIALLKFLPLLDGSISQFWESFRWTFVRLYLKNYNPKNIILIMDCRVYYVDSSSESEICA